MSTNPFSTTTTASTNSGTATPFVAEEPQTYNQYVEDPAWGNSYAGIQDIHPDMFTPPRPVTTTTTSRARGATAAQYTPSRQAMFAATGPLAAPVGFDARTSNWLTARHQAAVDRLTKLHEEMSKPGWKPKAKSKLIKNPLSPAKALELYQKARYGNDNKIVRIDRNKVGHPLSKAERKERRAKQLSAVYGTDYPDPDDQRVAFNQGRKAYLELNPWRPRPTEEQKNLAKSRRTEKMALHHDLPNAIYAPPADDADTPEMMGYLTAVRSGLGTFRGTPDYAYENDWADPDEITDKDRQQAAVAFAEATGVTGLMPTYDPRLTTMRSAVQVYPYDDYIFEFKDMDKNPATPGNLLIYEKDEDGEKGRLVAANGYRLSKPSEGQQLRRLKQMDYYYHNPTVEERKKNKYTQFAKKYIKSVKVTGYQQIIKYINGYLNDLDLDALYRKTIDSKQPVVNNKLFRLYAVNSMPRPPVLDIYADLSPIAWNTLIARTARLFFELVIVPILQLKPEHTLEDKVYNDYLRFIKEHKSTTPQTFTSISPNIDQRIFMRIGMMQPDLEKAIINTIQNEIFVALKQHTFTQQFTADRRPLTPEQQEKARNNEQAYILHLMDLVIKEQMNCNMGTIVDILKNNQQTIAMIREYQQQHRSQKFDNAAYEWFFLNYMFLPNCVKYFKNKADVEQQFERYLANILPLVPVTPAMPKGIKANVTYWGKEYVDETGGPEPVPYEEDYGKLDEYVEPDTVPAGAYTENAMIAPTDGSAAILNPNIRPGLTVPSSSSSSMVGTPGVEQAAAAAPPDFH